MRRALLVMLLVANAASALNSQMAMPSPDDLIAESSFAHPNIYSRYIRDMTMVTCLACTGPDNASTDMMSADSVTCITTKTDVCENASHVKEYYCSGGRVGEKYSLCSGNLSCSAGICDLLPDLTISRIDLDPGKANTHRYVSAMVEVANEGFEPSPPVNLTLYFACEPITAEVPALEPGNSTVIAFPDSIIFTAAGEYEIIAFVDSGYESDEYREDNNNGTKSIRISLPGEIRRPGETTSLGDEYEADISCATTPQMAIGRAKDALGDYYRDPSGHLLRGMREGPWDASPAGNHIPYADFWFELDPSMDNVSFHDNSTDDGSIVSWEWDFGDGDTSTDPDPIHMFSGDGHYMVTLTVEDDSGDTAQVSRSIFIHWSRPDMPRAEALLGYHRGLNVNHWDVSSQGAQEISEYHWRLGSHGTSDEDYVYHQYASPTTFMLTHTVFDEDGHNSTVQRTVQIDSIWLPGQGPHNACGTTSLAYTLRYLKNDDSITKHVVDEDIRAASPAHSFGAEGGMFSDPVSLVEYSQGQGLNAEIYKDGDFDEIKRLVDRGVPVIVALTTSTGGDVFASHWVVIVSYCERESPITPGVYETVYGLYNPWGYQYELPEDRLEAYWGKMDIWGIELWSRLYIAVSDQSLPAGDIDEIRTELALAQSIGMMTNGADDFMDGEIIEGLIEMVGGAATTVVGFLSEFVLGWGGHTDKVPLIGGIFGAADELVGGALLGVNEFINDFAGALQDLAANWYNPLVVLEAIGRMIAAAFELILDIIVAALEFIVDILVAIVEFIADIFKAIGEFFCWLFGMDCHPSVCIVETMVSPDECGETNVYINGMKRMSSFGHISEVPGPDKQPLYLYLSTNLTSGERDWKVSSDPSADSSHPGYVRIKSLGYSWTSSPSGSYDLTADLDALNLSWGESLGYLPHASYPDSMVIWLFADAETGKSIIGTDPCAGTRTFMSQTMDRYTRGKVVGNMRLLPADGTVPVYRYFNADKKDFFLSTDSNATEPGYVNSGMLGHAFTSNVAGTVPLHSFSSKTYASRNITVSCENKEQEFDTPIGWIYDAPMPCTRPVYQYCKRYIKQL